MDRRQRKTRNAVFQAFTRLLEKKTYSVLTVQDIIDEADIGRSTFYAHFETKDELLKALCNDIFDHVFSAEIMSEEKHDFSHHSSFCDRITHILYHLQEKQQSIRGLFNGECGEIFLRYLKEYLCQVFDEHITIKDDVPHERFCRDGQVVAERSQRLYSGADDCVFLSLHQYPINKNHCIPIKAVTISSLPFSAIYLDELEGLWYNGMVRKTI